MHTLRGKTSLWTYLDTDVLGSGGNSIVYKAFCDGETTTPYALKLFTDPSVSEKKLIRFNQEITTLDSLRGLSGCSELIDHGMDNGRPFYVMPYYSGGDLHKKFIKFAQVPRDVFTALNLFIQVTEIVSKLHAEPRVLSVRDIKPQNILLNSDGKPVVCDFGLALWAILAAQIPPANYESLGTEDWHLKKFLEDKKIALAVQGIVNQCTEIRPDKRPTAVELLDTAHSILQYCTDHNKGGRGNTLDDQLSEIAMQIPGSDLLATAAQKKAELDSKCREIDDCQDMLLARIREFELKLTTAFKDSGKFIIGGRERYRDEVSYRANVSIRFIPSAALQDTNMGRESRYVFHFGINSNNDFFWTEIQQVDGHDSERPLINPKSLTTLAAQKCGQIESILHTDIIPEVQRMLGLRPSVGATMIFSNGNYKGTVDFDYSSNDGIYTIGSGNWRFETKWSKADYESIHVYRTQGEDTGVAIAVGATRFWEIKNIGVYD